MSSTLSRPRFRTRVDVPTIVPLASAEEEAAEVNDEEEFRQFVRAIVRGVAIGFPLVWALMVVLVKVAAPDWELWGAVGIGLWVSIWTGMFLGGTVTVGLWSKRQHT